MPLSSSHLRPLVGSSAAVQQFHRQYPATLFSDEHYQKNAAKYWNKFYRRHQNKFFKDRHYLEKDWGAYFSDEHCGTASLNGKVLLEVGCGAGNTIFPLVAAYPRLYVHACDFSPLAIELVKCNVNFIGDRINAFICDVTNEDLGDTIKPSSVDVVTLIFMLSAVSPDKMPLILQNLKKVLKPHGFVIVRDYAIGDFAQVKLQDRNQKLSENLFVRSDGTCSFFFSEDFLSNLFSSIGFATVDVNVYCKQIENRACNVTMNRGLPLVMDLVNRGPCDPSSVMMELGNNS